MSPAQTTPPGSGRRDRSASQRRSGKPLSGRQRPRRRVPWWLWAGGLVVLAAAVLVALLTQRGGSPSTSTPLLASTQGEASGAVIDGIRCDTGEQAVFHIHAHLAVYVQGTQRTIREGIGIAPPRQVEQTDSGPFVASGSCFYWLHTHTNDGIIHIESPVQRAFTLGDLFDIWGQPLSISQVGPARGGVVAFVNSDQYQGDPRTIPLTAHAVIQLDVGATAPPRSFTFPPGL